MSVGVGRGAARESGAAGGGAECWAPCFRAQQLSPALYASLHSTYIPSLVLSLPTTLAPPQQALSRAIAGDEKVLRSMHRGEKGALGAMEERVPTQPGDRWGQEAILKEIIAELNL